MAKTDTWMPWYVADYLADTMHLSTEQHGAYCLLLMACWKADGQLPSDDLSLISITRLTPAKWRASKLVLMGFFKVGGKTISHGRVIKEREKAKINSDKKSAAGKTGAAKRWQSDGKGMADAMANGMADGMADAYQEAWQTDAPSPSPSSLPKPKQAAPQVLNTEGAASEKPIKPEIPPEPHPTALPATPLPDTSHNPTQAGLIAGDLRRRGVLVTAQHPKLLAWVRDGIFLPQIVEAVEIARMRLGEKEQIKPGYIDAIVRDPKAGKAAEPVDRWWDSQQGIDRKAKEFRIRPLTSDTYDTLKDKIFSAIKRSKNEERQSA